MPGCSPRRRTWPGSPPGGSAPTTPWFPPPCAGPRPPARPAVPAAAAATAGAAARPPPALPPTGFTATSLALDPPSGVWVILLTNAVHVGRDAAAVKAL